MKTNVVFREEVSPKGDTFSVLMKLCNVYFPFISSN